MTSASPHDGGTADDGGAAGDGALAVAYRLLVAEVYEVAGRSRQSSEHLARSLGQTVPRWHLLSVLADGPRSVAGAARRLGLARQSVQRVAGRLRADGLVTSSPDPADARAPRFALTDDGRRALGQLTERSDEVRARQLAASGLTVDDLRAARQVLRAVADALGPST
jgi:DNA-binding MarR family transcriptional regulator